MNDEAATDSATPVAVPVDGTLDLHGFRPQDANEVVIAYLEACREKGILEVRVVHGKGRSVLARSIHSALAKHDWIERFAFATPAFGGFGATFVHLKKRS
ncbi:MAG TPA: Smr/MutS family protein [Candidatus Limnocylindria bacterium]|jgi:DNA-nicking Smr family endonuclease|nr:Smr/MutS family protein [Candidatus Limnocylindria bacterium]